MYRRNEDFILREIAGEYIIIPTGKAVSKVSGMITVSETSAFIWGLLDTPRTLEELIAKTIDTYEVPAARAQSDIQQLLAKLSVLGMLLMG